MALVHNFYLVKELVDLRATVFQMPEEAVIDRVTIHDDIILYIMDSLNWVRAENPMKREEGPQQYGINYCGITLFQQSEARLLHRIFSAWRELFTHAPSEFKLTGNYVEDEHDNTGYYEKIKVEKAALIDQLTKMLAILVQLEAGTGYLYHYGI